MGFPCTINVKHLFRNNVDKEENVDVAGGYSASFRSDRRRIVLRSRKVRNVSTSFLWKESRFLLAKRREKLCVKRIS